MSQRQMAAELQRLRLENEQLSEARRVAEEARDRWIELYDCGPLASLTLDGQGFVQELNQAAVALLRPSSPRRNMTGARLRRFVRETDHKLLANHLARCALSETSLCCEIHLLDETPVQLWSRRVRPGLRLYPTAMVDLRPRERADSETRRLAEAEKVARQSIEAKDRFIASLSHELRTPLTPVLAAVTALKGRADVPIALRNTWEMIRRNVQTEVRLIDDLLDVSRITQGKMRVSREPADVHAALRDVLQTLDGELTGKRISLGVFLEAARHTASVDLVRIKQVFWNLIRNAVKFTAQGGRIEVRSWNDDAPGGGRLHLEVSDDGIGFDPNSAPRLFEAFEQGAETPERNGGLGLGLAICRGIMNLHGGTIAAASPGRGRGARFVIEIDTVSAQQPSPPAAAPATPEPASGAPHPRILLVEDDPDTADVLQELLVDAGYQVRMARSAKAALALDLDSVDLLISDIGLPDVSGLDLMRSVKKERGLRGVALSGYGTEADILASQEAGFSAHLTKPVDFDRLLAVIHSVGA
jgi:signal transduction histidine kinase